MINDAIMLNISSFFCALYNIYCANFLYDDVSGLHAYREQLFYKGYFRSVGQARIVKLIQKKKKQYKSDRAWLN